MAPASMLLHSKGEPSFPNPSLAQMQTLQKWESMFSRGFYSYGRHFGNIVYCTCMSKYLRVFLTQYPVMKIFPSDNVLFWIMRGECWDLTPESTMPKQEDFESTGQLEA